MTIKYPLSEKYIRDIFDVGVAFKGIDGILQVIGGVILTFIRPETINHLLIRLTQYELVEDPHDKIANYILHAGHLSVNSEKFAILFLLSHGLIKIFIVVGLLKNKLWAYPTGIMVFAGFGVYQMYRYFHTHSIGLLMLTSLDVFVIALTWHEYNLIKKSLLSLPRWNPKL